MKQMSFRIFIPLFAIVLILNMVVIISGMNISKDIHSYDSQTQVLTQENIDLEQQTDAGLSFAYTDQYKEKWGFTTTAKSVEVGELPYAFNVGH